ncbi:MAG: aminotransferase class I/II-fold pyridoxal phosphate-dependent enzyme [Candidatus Micrarchaeota archaeon]
MILALLIGRKGSEGFPGKNTENVLGKPLMAYPLEAAKNAKSVDAVCVSTDDDVIMGIGRKYGAEILVRPPELCTSHAVADDVLVHAYNHYKQKYEKEGKEIELVVFLFCNAPLVNSERIEQAIDILRKHPEYDSVASVSKYNMWSPLRARKIGEDGLLKPFVPFELFGDPKKLTCNRDTQGDVWFYDVTLCVIRPKNIENIEKGMTAQRWLGQKIYPLKQEGGLDIDYEWEFPQMRYWLKKKWRENNKGNVLPKKNLDGVVRVENAPETRAGFLRLDKNENTLGLDEKFLDEVKAGITADFINMYPEVYQTYEKLSKWLNIGNDQIYVTAGSDAGIKAAFEAFVDEGDEVVVLDPTYAMYYVYSNIFGAKLKKVPFSENMELEKDAVIKAITNKTRLICIANPNAPTGTLMEKDELVRLIRYAEERGIVVLLDEAYYLFNTETMIDRVNEFKNLMVTRSFTKGFGLGCARLGFAVSNKEITLLLKKFRPMYEVNSFAVLLGNAILDNMDMVERNIKKFHEGKKYLEDALDEMRVHYFKSHSNFILIDVGSPEVAKKIDEALVKRKVLIRTGFGTVPLNRCVRASIGTKEQMETFFKNFKEVVAELGLKITK